MNRTPRLLTTLCFLASTAAFGASATQGYADVDNPYIAMTFQLPCQRP